MLRNGIIFVAEHSFVPLAPGILIDVAVIYGTKVNLTWLSLQVMLDNEAICVSDLVLCSFPED